MKYCRSDMYVKAAVYRLSKHLNQFPRVLLYVLVITWPLGRLANLSPEGSCDNWLVAVQTPSLSNHYRTNDTDISMDISERFSLWKEQAECESVRHQK